MSSTESLAAYQGKAKQLTKRFAGTTDSVPDTHRWGILTNGLLDVYRTSVRMVNLPFEDHPR